MTTPPELADGEARCDAHFGWCGTQDDGPDPFVHARCTRIEGHQGPHTGEWHHGTGNSGVTSLTWDEEDRRTYRRHWQRCDARIPPNGPRDVDWVAAHRCLLPANHDGRHE